jgi:hypothetical protein
MDDIKELQDLNYEEAKQYIGGVVFVSIIMIIGNEEQDKNLVSFIRQYDLYLVFTP